MKTVTAMLLLAMTTATGMAHADGPAPERQPMRPVSECLRPDRVNEWYVVDNRTVIARTGPDRYLVKLTAAQNLINIYQTIGGDALLQQTPVCQALPGDRTSAATSPLCTVH